MNDSCRRAILGVFHYHNELGIDPSLGKTYLYLQPTENDCVPIYISEDIKICTSYSYEEESHCHSKPNGDLEFCDDQNSYHITD
jgi:hypothetical protein